MARMLSMDYNPVLCTKYQKKVLKTRPSSRLNLLLFKEHLMCSDICDVSCNLEKLITFIAQYNISMSFQDSVGRSLDKMVRIGCPIR